MGNLAENQDFLDFVNNTLHSGLKTLMGVHCKRIEILARDGKFDPELYKDLSKELIWEHYRNIIKIIEVRTLPSITFVDKK